MMIVLGEKTRRDVTGSLVLRVEPARRRGPPLNAIFLRGTPIRLP